MSKAARSFRIAGSSRHLPPDKDFHAEHIVVDLKVDLQGKRIAGSCMTRLVPSRKGCSLLHFDAGEMSIERVSIDGRQTNFDHDGKVLSVYSPDVLGTTPHVVKVDYSAQPRRGVYFVTPDEKHPERPIQAWTQGEPEFARYWFPCYDHPNDKASSEMVITVPEGYQVVSNGRLLSKKSDQEGRWVTYHWGEAIPHSNYLNSFVVGKFGLIEEEVDGIPLQYYFPESKSQDARRLFGLTPDMVRTFQDLTKVRFPYEKYAQVAVHDFLIGGMENVSATTLTDTRFPDARSEEDYSARYSRPDRTHVELVAHELAHMWFGDLVTAKHWSHVWVNEGFATYFQALYTERKFGVDEFRQDMEYKAESYFEFDDERYRRAIIDDTYIFPDDVFDGFVYEKGAWMLHQLRFILGDELFLEGTSEYLRRFSFKNADTRDYMNVLEERSGLSLEAYFDQSFYKAGHPELEVTYSWDEDANRAELRIKQAQETDSLTPVFTLPLEVVFYVGPKRLSKRIRMAAAEEAFHWELPEKPTIVEVDPANWILKKLRFPKTFGLLINQLERSADCSSRKAAATDLSSFRTPQTVQALKRAVQRDQHWSARAEASKSIGKIGTPEALDALLELIGTRDRKVRRAVVEALSEFKDERVRQPLLQALREDESPYVQCQAALSYAKTQAPDALDVLKEAMSLPSPENAIAEACLEAMGELKLPSVREALKAHLPYGEPTRVRIGALKGYSRLGWLTEEEVEIVKEILRKDPEYVVRAQALELVSRLEDRRFIEAVRRVSEEDVDPRNRRFAMEIAIRLAESLTPQRVIAEVREEVEKVKTEVRERSSGMKLS